MDSFKIKDRAVGAGAPCLLVGEVGQAHDGSLGMAHQFVELVAKSGFDAIKFQAHIASEESTLDEPFRIISHSQDATRYDYWKRMEFTKSQWKELAQHTEEVGLIFLCSPFSIPAVEMLMDLNVPAWKVASGEVLYNNLIDCLIDTGLPIILSNGLITNFELDQVVERIQNQGNAVSVLQCTSKYPTPLESVGVNCIEELRKRFGVPVGLSDHTGTIWSAILCMVLGIDLLEVHVTLSKMAYGPDTPASLIFEELNQIVQARKAFDILQSNSLSRDELTQDQITLRNIFFKSVAPTRALTKGEVLTEEMLTLKKPGTGIEGGELNNLIGRSITRDIPANVLISSEDLD